MQRSELLHGTVTQTVYQRLPRSKREWKTCLLCMMQEALFISRKSLSNALERYLLRPSTFKARVMVGIYFIAHKQENREREID